MPTTETLIDGSTREHYTTKETAQLIREALKAAFPGFRFSVTTSYASMYQATSVRWTDGPTEDEVRRGSLASNTAVLEALNTIAADPAAAAKAYGALMGRCSYCDKALTDEGSVEVGYGPVCAAKYGLPHHPKGTRVLEPAAAA